MTALRQLRLGLDLDGVFANFNRHAAHLLREVSGRALIENCDDFLPDVWDWFPAVGYRASEIAKMWECIEKRPDFWLTLDPLAGAIETLKQVSRLHGTELWFLTRRPGATAHHQSVEWLARRAIRYPHVIIVNDIKDKGRLASALGLDVYVDDHPETLVEMEKASPTTRLVLFHAPYNAWAQRELNEKYGVHLVEGHGELRVLFRRWFGGT